MGLTRKQIGQIYRPQGPKAVSLGNAITPASANVVVVPGAQIDLSNPIEGFRLVLKLRDVIGTAAMTSANPLGYLNLISNIRITGKNSRAGGNITLWDVDLPSIVLMQCMCGDGIGSGNKKPFLYNGVSAVGAASAGTELAYEQPSTPVANFFNGTTGTYDIRIAVDLPAWPFGIQPMLMPGYFIRSQEWADSLQIRIQVGQQTNGVAGVLGTDAGTTTHTFTSFGSGAGSPTLDVYTLPAIMGVDLDPHMSPGAISRVTLPVSSVLQSAGGLNTRLVTMEKQNTTRVFAVIGTGTITPAFATLSDTNLTTLGMFIGGNRTVRENDDIHAHKMDQVRRYTTQPIQGCVLLDYLPSGNPDSHYDAGDAGEGSTLELRGTVAGVANAQGIFIQEVERFKPQGFLYSA